MIEDNKFYRFLAGLGEIDQGRKLANKWKKEGRERGSWGNGKVRDNFWLVEGGNS